MNAENPVQIGLFGVWKKHGVGEPGWLTSDRVRA